MFRFVARGLLVSAAATWAATAEKKTLKLAYISSRYYPDGPPNNNSVAPWGRNDENLFHLSIEHANTYEWCGPGYVVEATVFQANGTGNAALRSFVKKEVEQEFPPIVFLGGDWGNVAQSTLEALDDFDAEQILISAGSTGASLQGNPRFMATVYSDADAIPVLLMKLAGKLQPIPTHLNVKLLFESSSEFSQSGARKVTDYVNSGALATDVNITNASFSLTNAGLLGGRHMTAEEVLEDHVLRDSIVDSVAQKVSVLMSGAENTSTVIFISATGPGTTVALMGLQKAGYNAQDELASGAVWTIGATEAPASVIFENGTVISERLKAAAGYRYYLVPSTPDTSNCAQTYKEQFERFNASVYQHFPLVADPLSGGFAYFSYDLARLACEAIRFRDERQLPTSMTLTQILQSESFPGVQGVSGFLNFKHISSSPASAVEKLAFMRLELETETTYKEIPLDAQTSQPCPWVADLYPDSVLGTTSFAGTSRGVDASVEHPAGHLRR